jgi:hypothetical protein
MNTGQAVAFKPAEAGGIANKRPTILRDCTRFIERREALAVSRMPNNELATPYNREINAT